MDEIEKLYQSLIDRIEARGKRFLDENAGSRDFVYERTKRLATLGIGYLAAKDDDTRARLDGQMESVRQSIENELSAVAVHASIAAREEFMGIVNDVIGVLRTLLPVVIGMLKR